MFVEGARLVQFDVIFEHCQLDVGMKCERVSLGLFVHGLEQIVAVEIAPQVHRLGEHPEVDIFFGKKLRLLQRVRFELDKFVGVVLEVGLGFIRLAALF